MRGYLNIRNIPKNTLKKINAAAKYLNVSRQAIIDILLRNALLAMGASSRSLEISNNDEEIFYDQDDDLVTASSVGEEDVRMADINSLQI